jgi:dihydrofolate synthase/folylpolyglutamate synthase
VTPSQSGIDYLFGLELFGMKLGLENMQHLVEALGHPERRYTTVHVAGTNGKGSVTAMVDAALNAAGHRCARYTSPHLIELNERFVIAGAPVDTGLLEAVARDVRDTIATLLAQSVLRAPPTFFEATTAVAFELFGRLGVDLAVCEVGLGGRLDATNVLTPAVTAITSIGHDHDEQLGSTLDLVAREKAGIIKPGVPVVVGRIDPLPAGAIAAVATERGAPLIEAHTGVLVREDSHTATGGQRLSLRTPKHDYGPLELRLAGAHQIENAVVAVRILEALDASGMKVPPEAIKAGLKDVQWPGRLDRRQLPGGRDALFDAAHNREGAQSLAAFLKADPEGPRVLVFGAMRDKDVAGMLGALLPVVTTIVAARAPGARAAEPSDLAEVARRISPATPVLVAPSSDAALDLAWSIAPRIVVAGSIFLIGDILRHRRGSW